MKQEKKQNYENNIYCAIHTVSGTTGEEITITSDSLMPAVKTYSTRKKRGTDEQETYLQMNPNKLDVNEELFRSYSEFEAALNDTLISLGLNPKEYTIKRCDLCFNSENQEDYLIYKKLHKLIIACIAETYQVKNTYQTFDLWTYAPLSIAAKNSDIEIESYDKQRESNGKSTIASRMELRSKRLETQDLQFEFLARWYKRLTKSIQNYQAVQEHYNRELSKMFLEDLEKPRSARKYHNMNAFLMQYSDCIFRRGQLIDLYVRLGVEDPKRAATNFKRSHRIEFFSQADLEFITDVIRRKAEVFFNS